MRTFSIFRPTFFRTIGGWICAAACVLSSCVDDTFDKYGQGISPYLTFEVEVPASWTGGQAACSAAGQSDISIKRMTRSDGGKPLYLVTEISEAAADTAASGVISRGTPVDTQNFPGTFGLFAFGTDGASWTEGGTEKTSYENMEVKKGTNGVWMPQTETLWQWPGKGQIDFYAYSPRIDDVLSLIEEPADEGDENAPTGGRKLSFSYSVGEDNKPVLAYTVPSDVTQQIDLMAAHHTYKGDGSECAHLTFSHALTAVTIKTGEEMLKGTIKSVTISGVYGEGTYQIGAEGWTIPQGDDKKREFVVTLGNDSEPDAANEEPDTDTGKGRGMYQEGNTSIVEGEYTFMMIPQELHEGAKLTVVFTDEFSQTEWTLTADLKDQIWPMGKMVTYSINSTGIVVKPVVTLTVNRDGLWPNGGFKELENTQTIDGGLYGDEMDEAEKNAYLPVSGYLRNVKMSAFVQMAQADKQTVKLPLTCTIEYSIDKENWFSQLGGSKPVWIPVSSEASRSEPDEVKKGAIRLPAQEVFNDTRKELLEIAPVKSSETDYYDLVANNPFQKESANCYMVHTPGYYKFPAAYGNTYRDDSENDRAYKYQGDLEGEGVLKDFVLTHFVGYDDKGIDVSTDKIIPDIADAVIVWQDSPDLVTDVCLKDGWVHFRILEETINQGNAVIAVRNERNDILWSWHIWVTHYFWTEEHIQESSAVNEEGRNFLFAPCNLGYCDSHGGNPERPVYMRLTATMPGMTEPEVLKEVTVEGMPAPDKDGIFTFTQPRIVASMAGDNTYYQWGRKDPMLPGVYDEDILNKAPNGDYKDELDMENKMFYSTSGYRFTSRETYQSIGESIQYPYCFFIHERPATTTNDDKKDPVNNYKRRHWHNGLNADGKNTSYNQKTIMNFWNSQLDESGPDRNVKEPNQKYVVKTIYDPSPAGYKIPPPTAFSGFFDIAADSKIKIPSADVKKVNDVGWKIKDKKNGLEFFFPSTGLRDMGLYQRSSSYGTWPAHSKLTFIATSGFQGSIGNDGSSCMLFSIDSRNNSEGKADAIYGTNNAYGFTLRPIRDHQHAIGTR
ncbi:MAG: fimbrillin family protein [Phocaeicola sp.]|nr:fimbrillin family protein [Phocaeicola sp.]